MSIIANREHRDLTDRIADIGGIVIPFDVSGARPPTAASPHLTSLSDIATTTSAEVDGSLILTGAAPYVKIGGVAKAIPYSGSALSLADSVALNFGDANDIVFKWDGTDLLVTQAAADSVVKWGVSGAGINHVFYGDTAGRDLTWDQTNNQLLAADSTAIGIGSGAGAAADITLSWNGTKLLVSQLTANSAIDFGVDGAGIDLVLYGDTASATVTWDQSADKLVLAGVSKIQLQTIAAATATPIPVTHSGSFPVTTAAAETNTLPDPTYLGQTISIFADTYAVGDRVITAASRINQTGNTIITLGAAGDFIKLEAITIAGALKWQVIANDGAALS